MSSSHCNDSNKPTMSHPSGDVVEILGIKEPGRGRSCEWHEVCGAALEIDSVVRLRSVQVEVNGKEEASIAVYWISDGVDRCRVGFLGRHLVKHKDKYDGKVAQVVSFLEESDNKSERNRSHYCRGIAQAAIVGNPRSPAPDKKKKRIGEEAKEMERKKACLDTVIN
jgi:hypothetical protein